ncbi:MAG TPA: hypothetical protein VMI54_19300 [Polyangiaceae bacterium]|nr:hypothetical protein [Polyangiaceae bacterium]
MNPVSDPRRPASRARPLLRLPLVVLCVVGCHAPPNFLLELGEARETAADLRIQFNQADDASNRSVMADTDEASIAFAHEAQGATQRVENDRAALTRLLQDLNYRKELDALADFDKRWADYVALDRTVLELAVENTNLKAQKLAFGPEREAADAFRAALETVPKEAAAKDGCRVDEIVAGAVLAVREIQVMQPPHIAEPSDETMTRLEAEMSARRAAARAALGELAPFIKPGSPSLAAATAALDRFDDLGAQIVKLSRQNTNVRSLDLALRAKPPLTAQCDQSLHRLQDALLAEGSKATR